MALFHRFVDPTYFTFPGESFPAAPGGTGTIGLHTYDRVNVESGGIGGGTSANADAQVAAGLNTFTYFIQFGQDATSLATNRGFRAVFESLDTVDDILRTSLPRRASQAAASPASISVVVTGEVFVSDDAGTPANELFYIVETATGRPIYNGLTRVVIADVDNGAPGTIIGTGWFTNPRVLFNTTVNVAYTLYYGTRTTYGRVAEEENSLWWVHNVAASRTAIAGEGQGLHGLDERYRRATDITDAAAVADTPGSGASIVRDGQAIAMSFPVGDMDVVTYPDPWLAGHRVAYTSYAETVASSNHGGDLGFLALSGARATGNTAELSAHGPMRGVVGTYIPRSIDSDTIDGTTFTRIPAAAAATLNVAGVDSSRLLLTAPNYFKSGTETAFYDNIDVLLVDFGGGVVQAYLGELDSGLADGEIRLKLLTGELATFSSDTAVTVTWYSGFFLAGGTNDYVMTYAQPRPVGSSNNPSDYAVKGLRFISDNSGWDYGPQNEPVQIFDSYIGGGFGATDLKRTMEVYANGNILSLFNTLGYETDGTAGGWGRLQHAFTHRTLFENTVVTTSTFFISPDGSGAAPGTRGLGFSALSLGCTGAGGGAASTINIDSHAGVTPGTVCEIFIENFGDGVDGLDLTLVWGSSFIFSDPADAGMGAANLVSGAVVHFKLTSMITISSSGPKWFVERVGYTL